MRKFQICLIYFLIVLLVFLIYLRVQLAYPGAEHMEPVDAEASEPWELPHYAYANEKMEAGWRAALNNFDIWATNDTKSHVQTIIYGGARTIYRATDFAVNGYCGCSICAGSYSENRPTDGLGNELIYGASGRLLKSGYSVAVDPRIIPHNSTVFLGSRTLIAEDSGPTGHQINIYWATHDLALQEPDHNISHGVMVWWTNDIFQIKEVEYISNKMANGEFFDLTAAGKTINDIYEGDSNESE